jgi:hypothetical protein
MKNHDKVLLTNKYQELDAKVKEHLSILRDFLSDKMLYPEGDPDIQIYNNAVNFLRYADGEYIEFKYLNRKFWVEVDYASNYAYATLRTYEIFPGERDRSKKKYVLIEHMDINITSKGALAALYGGKTIPATHFKTGKKISIELKDRQVTELKKNYIDLLWAVVIEPSVQS